VTWRIYEVVRKIYYLKLQDLFSVSLVSVRTDGIQTQQFSRHMKTGHLLTSIFLKHTGLQKSATNGKQGLKARTSTMQVAASLNFPFIADDITQNLNFLIIKTDRQTKLAQTASSAAGSYVRDIEMM
jgi:hypothetical protein